MKSSAFSRTLEMAKLAAKVGYKELRSTDMKSRIEQAVLIANSLSNLKGAAMKAGQLLSLDLDNYFPPEAIEVLSQLQNAATAHPLSQMEPVLSQELSPTVKSNIKQISPLPIGVASIGQVHRAIFEGQDIVLKIQYPGVADSIDSDLKILKTVAVSFCKISGRKMNLDPLFEEFRSVLEQEVDYRIEANNQMQYAQHVIKLNDQNGSRYYIPKVINGLTTKRVLGMSYESGQSLRSWIATKPGREEREDVSRLVLNLYFHEFFEWGLVQTDPNWGNFLIDTTKENLRLGLLDFGATRTYSKEFITRYIQLLNLAAEKKTATLKEHAIEFGLIDKRESDEAFRSFEEMLSTAIKPFFRRSTDSKLFDFADKNHMIESQEAAKALADKLVYSPPPYSLIFLHRKLAGVYSILKSLEVQLDISSYWEKMTELSSRKN